MLFLRIFNLSHIFLILWLHFIKCQDNHFSDNKASTNEQSVPISQLSQWLLAAKLIKDLQQLEEKKKVANEPDKDEAKNYLFFLGKGNIQLQNHQMEIASTTEQPETTQLPSDYYNDLTKNKQLLKFVSKNGANVWKRMQMAPSDTREVALPTPVVEEKDVNQELNLLLKANGLKVDDEMKIIEQMSNQKKPKATRKPAQLYIPPIQVIESEGEIIQNTVEHPEWFKTILEQPSMPVGQLVPIFQKKSPPMGMPSLDRPLQVKTKKKVQPTSATTTTVKPRAASSSFFTGANIGRMVMSGFTGFIRGIGSFLGFFNVKKS